MQVTLTWGSAHTATAGELTITPSGGDAKPWASIGWKYPTAFESFCLEVDEYVSINRQYYAEFAYSADAGGNGGPSPDPICKASAWLYRGFISGTIGYRNNEADARALQQALWWLENESYTGDPAVYADDANELPDNKFLKAVANAPDFEVPFTYNGLNSLRDDDANGAYGVGVLRLYGDANHTQLKQDVFIVAVPEPTTLFAGALLALPFGIKGILWLRVLRR